MKDLICSAALLVIILCQAATPLKAQNHTQTIRGTILDKDAQSPLTGATVLVQDPERVYGAVTDEEGRFRIEQVPVGRRSIEVSYLGYEPVLLSSILLGSGKELVLNIEMVEAAVSMEEVVVRAATDKAETLNELASVSARSFSVEETSRYAGSYFDPARMAQNFAGVSVGTGDDLNNEIIVRGNSPSGLLWRLEGVEIPNPNHFASLGNSGGAVSMLSSSILTNSDFYTGAFPAEFGNALSGVFDLNMRNGNNQRREYAFMLGALGLEASMEGPFRPGSRASYLVNYRYSTLALLQAIGFNPAGDQLPKYQDLSFKINLPTKSAGTFALFGLGGTNQSAFLPQADSTKWAFDDDHRGFTVRQKVGTLGLSHRMLLSENSYLRTVLVASANPYREEDFWLDKTEDYERHTDQVTEVGNYTFRISTTYNHKFNARNTLRAGIVGSHVAFDFTYDEDEGEGITRFFDNRGDTRFLQAFAHWKHRFNDRWALNAGLHYSQLMLNNQRSLEPRAALEWQVSPSQKLSASLGLHSRMEHLAVYLFDGILPEDSIRRVPARGLELSKSMHAVLAYDQRLGENLRLKAELYFQHLYDVPVEGDTASRASLLNASNIWDAIDAQHITNQGRGRNFGLDITLEKFFSDQYYFMLTGSLYDSRFRPADGRWYHTAFNGQYQLVALGGKEFKVGQHKSNILGLNGKFVLAGGRRQTPVNLEASRTQGKNIFYEDRPFSERLGTYARIDFGISYRINTGKMTHSIMLDIQNVSNRLNVYGRYYSESRQDIRTYYQTGLLPVFNYRIEF